MFLAIVKHYADLKICVSVFTLHIYQNSGLHISHDRSPLPSYLPLFYILYESYLIHCYWSSEAMLLKSNMSVRPSITNFPVWLWNRLMSIGLKSCIISYYRHFFYEYWNNKKEIIAVLLAKTFGPRGSNKTGFNL